LEEICINHNSAINIKLHRAAFAHIECCTLVLAIVAADQGNKDPAVFNKLSLHFRGLRMMLQWKCLKEVDAPCATELRYAQLHRDVSKLLTVEILITALDIPVSRTGVGCLLLTVVVLYATWLLGSMAGYEYWLVRLE